MTKIQFEHYKKKIEQIRSNAVPQTGRSIDVDDGEINQIYEEWVSQYLAEAPNFKKDGNKYQMDGKGKAVIMFSDPQAEEHFVRHLATKKTVSGITDKGIVIAKFQDGKVLDPRTDEEFPKGGYAALVQKLDSGMAYDDIPSPKSTAPSPFSITPY